MGNALENVVADEDFEYLTDALGVIVREHPFETSSLFEMKARLHGFLDEDVVTGSERTSASAVEEESPHPTDNHIHYRLVQDCLNQALSSPKLVICDDACDDDSCATMY